MKYALVSMREDCNETYLETRDGLDRRWCEWFSRNDIIPVPVQNCAKFVKPLFHQVKPSLVILTGGNDISEGPGTSYSDPRNLTEQALISSAINSGTPIFGVCRGLQYIYHYFTGIDPTVISKKPEDQIQHVGSRHIVRFSETFVAVAGSDATVVNSYHAYGLWREEIQEPFMPVAWSDDGVVEGIVHRSAPIAAVQWHPERGAEDRDLSSKIVQHLLLGNVFWKSKV